MITMISAFVACLLPQCRDLHFSCLPVTVSAAGRRIGHRASAAAKEASGGRWSSTSPCFMQALFYRLLVAPRAHCFTGKANATEQFRSWTSQVGISDAGLGRMAQTRLGAAAFRILCHHLGRPSVWSSWTGLRYWVDSQYGCE